MNYYLVICKYINKIFKTIISIDYIYIFYWGFNFFIVFVATKVYRGKIRYSNNFSYVFLSKQIIICFY